MLADKIHIVDDALLDEMEQLIPAAKKEFDKRRRTGVWVPMPSLKRMFEVYNKIKPEGREYSFGCLPCIPKVLNYFILEINRKNGYEEN